MEATSKEVEVGDLLILWAESEHAFWIEDVGYVQRTPKPGDDFFYLHFSMFPENRHWWTPGEMENALGMRKWELKKSNSK